MKSEEWLRVCRGWRKCSCGFLGRWEREKSARKGSFRTYFPRRRCTVSTHNSFPKRSCKAFGLQQVAELEAINNAPCLFLLPRRAISRRWTLIRPACTPFFFTFFPIILFIKHIKSICKICTVNTSKNGRVSMTRRTFGYKQLLESGLLDIGQAYLYSLTIVQRLFVQSNIGERCNCTDDFTTWDYRNQSQFATPCLSSPTAA